MKLSSRVWILISSAILGMVVLGAVALYELRGVLQEERNNQLAILVELAHAAVTAAHEREKAGEMSREEAQLLAAKTLGAFRKGDRYFWARGYGSDVNTIHPNPKRVGVIDEGGKEKGVQYRAALEGKTVGYLLAEGSRPGVKEKVPKLYAVMRFEPWDWIIGYGDYVDDLNATFRRNASVFAAIALLVVIGVGVLALGISRTIFRQLGGEPRYASRIAVAVAGGDLSQAIVAAGSEDSLLHSMRTMQEGLRAMVGRIRDASEQVTGTAGGLKRRMDEVSQGARQTAEATASTAAAVQQMSSSIDQVSASARETETDSRNAADVATRGEHLAVEAANEIRGISSGVEDAATVVRGLVERSREIDSMSGVIREIADQTNLLALTAAIEAARAGEQGRGFAVVADEVRKLAERTGAATQEITRTIRAIQADTATAANQMDRVRDQVNAGVQLAENAATALREINLGAMATLDKTRDVAHATREQSTTSASIANNVESISAMVDAADASVRAAVEQVRQLDALARELHEVAVGFKI